MPAKIISDTEDLAFRLLKAGRQYEALKAAAHALVDHWVITRAERYSLRLHYFERMRWTRLRQGEILPIAPKKGAYFRYGLMKDERVAVEEFYEEKKLNHEAFWAYQADAVEVIGFRGQESAFIRKLDTIDGLPALYREYAHGTPIIEKYTHWDARLTTITCNGEAGRWTQEYHCIYTPARELERIEMLTVGYQAKAPNIIYRSPKSVSALVGASGSARQALVNMIVATVEEQRIEEAVYALILAYTWPECFPPGVVPLYEEDRQTLLRENPAKLNTILLWIPGAVGARPMDYYELMDSVELWAELETEFAQNTSSDGGNFADDPARAVLAAVAHELNAVDWTGKLNTTPDFVVLSLDTEMDDVQERLVASVPQAKLDLLRSSGLW